MLVVDSDGVVCDKLVVSESPVDSLSLQRARSGPPSVTRLFLLKARGFERKRESRVTFQGLFHFCLSDGDGMATWSGFHTTSVAL